MDSSDSNSNSDTSWYSATNWTIASGSLENSVTFESSLSLITDEKFDNLSQSSAVVPTSKSPLILYPPSSDYSSPCEITITFAQKHEVRQVYVRSTSRVYEIYCASELQSSGEYLCTVRCGIAVRDGEVMHATDVEEAVLAHQKGSTEEPAEERLRKGSNMTASEDDWVEVAVSGNSSPLSNSDTSQVRSSQPQDLYEATADITDADPCTSITLKLLSLQNKVCICIDEVYVFADPVDAADLDNKAVPMENSAGNSLMAMIMPTFLQLSKQKAIGQTQDKCDNDRMNEQKSEKSEAKPLDPIDIGRNIEQEKKLDSVTHQDIGKKIEQERKFDLGSHQEVQLQDAVTPITKPVQLEILPQVSDKESTPDASQNHIEGVLNQLVSQVNRLEDLFFRFEDSMLKPIRSIDERLKRVEQQLEVLVRKPQNSGLLSCNRIAAPEFSCSESDTNSLYNSGGVDICYVACDANKKDSPASGSSILSEATTVPVNTSVSHPSLVVTAPEFSNCDDEEEDIMKPVKEHPEEGDNATEPVKDSPKEKRKHAMSIDDALASALAGFLTSTSVQSPKYSKTLAVKAPEFPNEEGNNCEKTTSPRGHCDIITKSPTGFSEPHGTELSRNSLSLSNISSESDISSESSRNVMRSPNNNDCGKTGVAEHLQHSTVNKGDSLGICINLTVPATHDTARTVLHHMDDDIQTGQICNGTSSISVAEKSDSREPFSGNQTDGYDIAKEGDMNELVTSTQATDERSNLHIVQNVVEFSHAASKVDFETPILEVTFASQENLNAKSPLEALLSGTPDMNIEAHPLQESSEHDSQIGSQFNLIPMEDWEQTGSATDDHI